MKTAIQKISTIGILVGVLASPALAQVDDIDNIDFEQGLTGWTAEGNATVQATNSYNQAALLEEPDSRGLSRIYQQFTIPDGTVLLSFRYKMVQSASTGSSTVPPDSFTVYLTDPNNNGERLVNPTNPVDYPNTKAFFYQDTNSPNPIFIPEVTVKPPDTDGFCLVALDVSTLTGGVDARLEFGLANGNNAVNSFVVIDEIAYDCPPGYCCDTNLQPGDLLDDGLPCTIAQCQPDGTVSYINADCCGSCNDALGSIAIMIDLSGSISANDLVDEKNAAKRLLDRFALADPRPQIAIGVFNVIATAPHARIVPGGELTDDYGMDGGKADGLTGSGLYAAINGLGGAGSGSTNIAAAFTVAKGVLQDSTTPKYVILISDGFPSYPNTPTPCSCSIGGSCTAADNAYAAAAAAEADGSQIISVYFPDTAHGGTCQFGETFMQNVASNPNLYFVKNDVEDLECIFEQVADLIACDDLNPDTVDTCDELGICRHDDGSQP